MLDLHARKELTSYSLLIYLGSEPLVDCVSMDELSAHSLKNIVFILLLNTAGFYAQ